MRRFYGVRLSDLASGDLTWRELRDYLTHLPREAATVRAQLGEDADWGLEAQLLAHACDALNAANWQRGSGKGKRPKPIPRPGVKSGKTNYGRASRSAAEVKAYLDRFKPKDGGEGGD